MSTESNTTCTLISEDNVFHTFILLFDLTTSLSRFEFVYAQPTFSKAQTTCLIVVVSVMVTYLFT